MVSGPKLASDSVWFQEFSIAIKVSYSNSVAEPSLFLSFCTRVV